MKRAIILVLDGLRRDSVTAEAMPNLHALSRRGAWFAAHRSVFPSVTRCCSTAFSTGCHPARNGIQGNTVALAESGRLVLRDVGEPDFLDHKQAATGTKVEVPTTADRVAAHGGFAIYSNGSPGSCRVHDPNGIAHVRNRVSGWGGADPGALGTTVDAAGDAALIRRYVAEAVNGPFAVTVAWCCEPDHRQHEVPLGSPEALAMLRQADERVAEVAAAVETRRAAGEDILFLVASDHGHDSVEAVVDVNAVLEEAGIRRGPDDDGLLTVANGNTSLLYALPDRSADAARALDLLRQKDWAGTVMDAGGLRAHGQAGRHNLFGAVALRSRDEPNEYGVRGLCVMAKPDFGKPDRLGNGMHGALGVGEQGPTLLAIGGGFAAGVVTAPSSLVDIAPTVLAHLGLPADGMDGRPLQAVGAAAGLAA
ncbi:alkaline phosphatase family protein [Roseomonas sp. CCTCC AB2023176]|uniref:alkaline phosphatase family protein n=1 Tax=Roseomonas sp. CCTCC AB2023176 TaxID=3342640 RepID=UPI0035D8806F